jgi:hypothetical protein
MTAHCCPKCGFILWRNDVLKEQFQCEVCNTTLTRTDTTVTLDQWVNEFPNNNPNIQRTIRAKYCNEIDQSLLSLREKIESGKIKLESPQPTPRCPTCGGTNIRKMGTGEKIVNTLAWGVFGNKRKQQYECQNPKCLFRW